MILYRNLLHYILRIKMFKNNKFSIINEIVKQKYIITLQVDGGEWNSLPIEGDLGDLQSVINDALEQHRISRFFTIRPKNVQFQRATLIS